MDQKELPENINYILYENDYIEFNYFVAWSNPSHKWKRLLRRLILPLIITLLMLSQVIQKGFRISEFIFIGFAVAYALFIPNLIFWRLKKRIKRLFKPDDQSVYGIKEFTFTEDTLNVKEGLSKSETDWKSFIKVDETVNYFYLFMSKIQAWIIPKTAFKTEEQLNIFKEFISNKIINKE